MKSQVICTAAMAIVLAFGLGQHAFALDKTPALSLDLAKKMAAACEAKAKDMSWKMNISVVDNGANEIFFERMDGAYLGSGGIARHKAKPPQGSRFPPAASSNWPTARISRAARFRDWRWCPASSPLPAACRS